MRLVVDLESLRSVNIGVPLRGRDRGVPEQFLDHPEVGAGDRLKYIEQSVRPHAQPAKGRRPDAKTMRRRFRCHLFADALVIEEVSVGAGSIDCSNVEDLPQFKHSAAVLPSAPISNR
jgi:hypothetical protein